MERKGSRGFRGGTGSAAVLAALILRGEAAAEKNEEEEEEEEKPDGANAMGIRGERGGKVTAPHAIAV